MRQSLSRIAAYSNEVEREAAREVVGWRFLKAIGRVKSEAEVALTKFEEDQNSAAGLVRISQLRADSASDELPPSPKGYYTPKDLEPYVGTNENNIRGRLAKMVKTERILKADLKVGGRWEIHDLKVARRVYKILKKKR